MKERDTEDQLAALEQARVQLEIALGANADWLAFRQAAAGCSRVLHERGLAADPLYKAWMLVNGAIQNLHAGRERGHDEQPCLDADDLTRIRGIDPALARRLAERGIASYGQIAAWRPDDVRDVAETLGLGRMISRQNWIEQAALLHLRRPAGSDTPPAPPRPLPRADTHSVGLHHVLEQIRKDAALRGDVPALSLDHRDEAPAPAATDDASPAPSPVAERRGPGQEPREAVDSPGSDGARRTLPEPEEATVTFIIREPMHAARVDDHSTERDVQTRAPPSDQAPTAEDAPYSPSGIQDSPSPLQVEEAEVAIVSRPADRPVRPVRRGFGTARN